MIEIREGPEQDAPYVVEVEGYRSSIRFSDLQLALEYVHHLLKR